MPGKIARPVRDLEVEPPKYPGRGAKPKTPFQRVEKWRASLPEAAWTKIDVRDGEKGPLVVELVKCRMQAKTDRRRVGPEEVLVVIRGSDEQGAVKHDYYLSNAPVETALSEFARVATAEHRIEECIQRGKSETGLADYQVRGWPGWHPRVFRSSPRDAPPSPVSPRFRRSPTHPSRAPPAATWAELGHLAGTQPTTTPAATKAAPQRPRRFFVATAKA